GPAEEEGGVTERRRSRRSGGRRDNRGRRRAGARSRTRRLYLVPPFARDSNDIAKAERRRQDLPALSSGPNRKRCPSHQEQHESKRAGTFHVGHPCFMGSAGPAHAGPTSRLLLPPYVCELTVHLRRSAGLFRRIPRQADQTIA